MPRVSVLLGNAGSTVSKAAVQAIVIFLVGMLIGARPSGAFLDWLLAAESVIAYVLGFPGLALSVASQTDDLMAYHAVVMLLNLPVLLLSNALEGLAQPNGSHVGDRPRHRGAGAPGSTSCRSLCPVSGTDPLGAIRVPR